MLYSWEADADAGTNGRNILVLLVVMEVVEPIWFKVLLIHHHKYYHWMGFEKRKTYYPISRQDNVAKFSF